MHRLLAIVFVSLGLIAVESPAAIIVTADGLGNTSAPISGMDGFDLPEFNNVGDRGGGGSAVYLGDRWLITAKHVGAGNVMLGGVNYTYEAGTATPLEYSPGVPTDLVMFRVETDPGLPFLNLATGSPSVDDLVVMVGNGLSREPDERDYNSSFNQVPPGPTAYTGYQTIPGSYTIRWGQNLVEDVGGGVTVEPQMYDVGGVTQTVHMFFTQFDDPSGSAAVAHEAQLTFGDSGGGVFRNDNGELVGINLVLGPYLNQPLDLALYGNVSGMADIASYRVQINAIMGLTPVPEPGAMLLVLVPGLVAIVFARRRRGAPKEAGLHLINDVAN